MHKLLTGALTVERVQVAIAQLPDALNGLRLVQLSDFHYDGGRLSETLLGQAIAATNAANPDLILLTGDFVTDTAAAIHRLVPWLQGLHSRSGICAVLGNHDNHGRAYRQEIIQALRSIGIQVLWNEIAYPVGAGLPIVGLADLRAKDFNPAPVMAQLAQTIPRLVLAHNPDSAERLQPWRVDLQLSGHTHGGQIWLPTVGNLSARMAHLYHGMSKPTRRYFPMLKPFHRTLKHWEWSQGLHTIGNHPQYTQRLYVNRGLGTYFPGRLFCPPEVTVMTLVSP